jgi:hypothetical protein
MVLTDKMTGRFSLQIRPGQRLDTLSHDPLLPVKIVRAVTALQNFIQKLF